MKSFRSVIRLEQEELRGHGIRVVLDLDESVPSVPADEIQIEQVILNLARNGVER